MVCGDEFWDKLKTARDGTFDVAKNVVSSELHNPWFSYLAIAMGAVLEERQYFVDCLKYYEWVSKNTTNPDLNTLMRMRWIKNKDRYLDRREQQERLNGPVDSASKRKIAMEIALERSNLKRTMAINNITSIDAIPDSFNIDWEQFFEEVFREIPADVASISGNGEGKEKEEKQGSSNSSESIMREKSENESSNGVIPIDDDTPESKGSSEVEEKQSESEEVNVDDEENLESDVESSIADTKVTSAIDNDNDLLNDEGEEMSNERQHNEANENQVDILTATESSEMVNRIQLFHAYVIKRFGMQGEQLPKIALSFKDDTGFKLTDYLGCKIAVCKTLPSFNKLLEYTTIGQRDFLKPRINTTFNKSNTELYSSIIKSMATQPPVDGNKLERWEQNFARNDELCFIGTINITPSEENPGCIWVDLTDCHDMNGEINVPRFACKKQDVVGVQGGSSVLGRRNPLLPDRPFFFSGDKMPVEIIDWRELKIEGSIRDLLCRGANARVYIPSKCLFEDVLIVEENRIYSGLRYSTKSGEIIVGNELREGYVEEFFAKNKSQCWYYLLDWREQGLFRLIAPKNNFDIGTQTILESVGSIIGGNSKKKIEKDSKNGDGGQRDVKDEECEFLKKFAKYVKRCGFVYSPRDLVRFHTSVKCCMFTLLGGTPGNGKSSLAKLYFQMLTGSDADSHDRNIRINVQPTWLEARDLEEAQGEGTNYNYKGFLDKARDEKDALLCACFEEVNLARVEHYMADIIQEIGKRPDVLESEMSEGKWRLPPNIRFVGTCNEDASVQPISRRFYDRCNKIELSVYNREAQIANAFGLKDAQVLPLKPGEGGVVTYAVFKKWCEVAPDTNLDKVKEIFIALLPELEKIDAHPSPRVIGEIARYVALRPAVDVPDSKDVLEMALDEAIVQRILPCCQPTPATIEYYGEEKLQKTLRDHHMDLSAEYVKSLKDDYDHMMMA